VGVRSLEGEEGYVIRGLKITEASFRRETQLVKKEWINNTPRLVQICVIADDLRD
jgi:hypothetical protein